MNEKVTLDFTTPSEEVIKTGEALIKDGKMINLKPASTKCLGKIEVEAVCKYLKIIRLKRIKKKGIRRGYVQRAKSMEVEHIAEITLVEPLNTKLDDFFEGWVKHLNDSENNHHESN